VFNVYTAVQSPKSSRKGWSQVLRLGFVGQVWLGLGLVYGLGSRFRVSVSE